jgi:hypothetical protein
MDGNRSRLPHEPGGFIERAISVFLVVLLAGCASAAVKSPVTEAQILEMSESGTPADEIIARMQESNSVYRMPASGLVALGEEGVPGPVLDYMQQTRFKAVSRRAAKEYYFETKTLNSWK